MSIHTQAHAMTDAQHTATNWSLFYSNGSGEVAEVALPVIDKPLLSSGPAVAPVFGTCLLSSAPVSAVGETPVAGDIVGWSNETLGVVVGTTARVFNVFKNSGGSGFSVELTALP